MSKKLKDLKWDSVALEGFPLSMSDQFQGFVGLEECTNYSMDKESKKPKKKKERKRKNNNVPEIKEAPQKKVKLSNGFVEEEITQPVAPSQKNEILNDTKNNSHNEKTNIKSQKSSKNNKNKHQQKNENSNANAKINKPKLGEDITQNKSELTPEDMLSWAEFKLQEPIMRALTELGFKQPTKIQQMTLPAAIHGRRDILGAAETGSGKTLAFGLPILSGILKLKEKAAAKGLDVYDIPYKKTSVKKKNIQPEPVKKEKNKQGNKRKQVQNHRENKAKPEESLEDGYSSGDEDDDEKEGDEGSDEYLEEIEVPLRKKRDLSADEGNDSEDSDNYVHLSDMLDSDDAANTSEDDASGNDDSGEEEDGSGNDDSGDEESEADIGDDSEQDGEEQVDKNEGGIWHSEIIDKNMPSPVGLRTGKPLYALILTPTRELAIQISRHLTAAAKYTGIRVATIVGGMAGVKQERVLRASPELVVATPGRLWQLMQMGLPHLQQLHEIKFLAIDETDRMVERGHFEELEPLLERLNADDDKRGARQNFVFSATLTMVHDLPAHMKGKKVTKRGKIINRKIEKMTPQQKINKLIAKIGMTDPKVVDITTQNLGTAETLTECRIACALEHKDAYLYYLLKRHPGRTIVFCNSIGCVRRLAHLFTMLKCRPLPLHASMPQRQRLKNLERFRDDPSGVLIATDVAARGLDIPDVDHVIQYQVPRTAENYVHRSGRTARANKEGLALLMMEPSEAYLYAKLCQTLNKTAEIPTFPVPPSALAPLKDLMVVARELDTLELRKRRHSQAQGWKEKAAREMDMIIDDDDLPVKSIDPSIDKALQNKRRQLERMLSRPVFPRGFSFKYPTLNDPAALVTKDENALQVMKKALESGELKKEKRKSKNAPLLKLEKTLKKEKK